MIENFQRGFKHVLHLTIRLHDRIRILTSKALALLINISFDIRILLELRGNEMQNFVRYFGFAILGIVISCTSIKKSEIISTDKDERVENILNEADQNTLVIFDCDKTLFTYQDALFHPNNSEVLKKVLSYLKDKLDKEAIAELFIETRKQYPIKLVNKNFPTVIQNLQAKGARVLLLTTHFAGKFRTMERIEDLRKAEISPFNFDFKKSWRDCPNFTFHDLPKVKDGITFYPKFDDGIIFACRNEKGIILKHFLKHIPMRFSRIIFVDDKMKNIHSVFGACQELKIPCTCIEYTKVKNTKVRVVDFETERKRFDDFIKTKKWKSDSED